jgi:hypothetical protein
LRTHVFGEGPLFEDRIAPVPSGQPDADDLIAVAPAGHPVFVPSVRTTARVLERKVSPRVAVGTFTSSRRSCSEVVMASILADTRRLPAGNVDRGWPGKVVAGPS